MDRLNFHWNRLFFILLMAVLLAGCINPAAVASVTPDAPADPGADSTVSPTPTIKPTATATATPQPPTPTPTATATPLPQPIGFTNISQLQIINSVENYDQNWERFSSALSPDGRMAAVAGCLLEGDDMACHGTTFFRLFDLQTGAALFDLPYLSPAIELLTFNQDGRILAAAGCDISLWIYGEMDTICDLPRAWLIDTETGEIIAELTGYTSHITDFVFSPDGAILFTAIKYNRTRGDGDHVIRAYEAYTGEKLATIETGMISCTTMLIDISPDGHYLIGNVTSPCGYQSFVAWWDVTDPQTPFQVGNVDSYSRSSVSPDSSQILVHNLKDSSFKLYDLATGAPLGVLPRIPNQSNLSRFAYLGDRDTLIFDLSSEYDIINIPSGQVVHRIQPPEGGSLYSWILTPDRSTLLVIRAVEDFQLEAWDVATWQSIPVPIEPEISYFMGSSIRSSHVTFLPDGSAFVGVDSWYGVLQSQTWGLPDATQSQAARALRDYFDLLVRGEYEKAAEMNIDEPSVHTALGAYVSFYTEASRTQVEPLLPGVDFNDFASVLSTLCQETDFPCMPVRDILYQAQPTDGLYSFTITFSLPDGSLADWPTCSSIPADHYCWHRGGTFIYYVYQTPEGSFKIVEGYPPAVSFLLEN